MRAVLISTYDLGRQPFGLASPAAWLRAAGWDVVCLDLAKDQFDAGRIEGAALVGFHLPMHTATRLAGPIIARTRTLNPSARLCAYGVYAPLNEPWLRALGVDARSAKRHLATARSRVGLAEDGEGVAVAQWLVTELIAPPTRALQLHLFAGGRA